MVSVALRGAVDVFAATLKPTVPDPDPDAPDVTVIQEALLVAFHTHPPAVATVLVPVPPAAANDDAGGVTLNVQATPPNEKVLVRVPPLRPPGPIASTTAS